MSRNIISKKNINNAEFEGNNIKNNNRKLISKVIKISQTPTNVKTNKIRYKLTDSNNDIQKNKIQFNIKLSDSVDLIKKIKQAKELKDLEKIYQKWNEDKVIFKIKGKNNIKTYKDKNEDLTKSNDKTSSAKEKEMERQKKIMEDKKKMLAKLKEIKKRNNNKGYSEEEIKEFENTKEKELNSIYQQSYLISGKKNVDMIQKLNYIIEVRQFIEKEIESDNLFAHSLILPEEAICNEENNIIKLLGYFGSELSLNHIKAYIEINPSNEKLRDITFKILGSGLATQKIYKICLENVNDVISFEEDIENWFLFLENIKTRISKILNVSEEDIYIFGHNLAKLEAYFLIFNRKFNNFDNLAKNLKIKIIPSTLLNNVILSTSLFNAEFSKDKNDWPDENLKRGGRKYFPPYGWIGIALNIKDKYKTKNDKWIGKVNKEGEWTVAYHGVGKGNVFNKVLNIINNNLKEGSGQLYKEFDNNEESKDKYMLCGEGVYVSPNIEEAMKYADKISLGNNSLKFKFVIMVRVNPNKIRSPGGSPAFWILNGNESEIRPYRLLIKTL